ncbi:hypothetical protein COL52_20115 [Bacillus toyonensis]|nr:hypothetical protein CN688_32500 [Bacillus toyonensis]PEK75116.1 hypothetical protein CN594_31670 [Bacillus toyonensis]PEL26556.1 hypothetical protein CN624_12990 [Bacillus toyonensis]PEO50125.1 hypothetical protein CN579_28990 [Bacillus toyonensis]PFY58421.1 hypothetical protein COL52_20115 [Bacillus toyonensis]
MYLKHMAKSLNSCGFKKTSFDIPMILFDEIIEMLNGLIFRIHIKIVIFQFFERTKWCSTSPIVRTVGYLSFPKHIDGLIIPCFTKLDIQDVLFSINCTIKNNTTLL